MVENLSRESRHVVELLRSVVGEVRHNAPLASLFEQAPELGGFDWMLVIVALEIDLRVDIPIELADDLAQTVGEFARRVSALPRVDSPSFTLQRLSMVSEALLEAEPDAPCSSPSIESRTAPQSERASRAQKSVTGRGRRTKAKAAKQSEHSPASSSPRRRAKAKPRASTVPPPPRRDSQRQTSSKKRKPSTLGR